MKKALVTGGSGFIASFLVEELQKTGNYHVTVFDLDAPKYTPKVAFIRGDITDRKLVFQAMKGQDIVFHYAGILGTHETVENTYETARVNVLGFLNVLDAARESGTKVVDITKPNYWRNPYTITKVAAEEFGLMYRDEFQVPVVLIRYFNVYGPRQKTDIYQKAVPTFILKALKNEPIPIFGDGNQGTDHIFVEDAIGATLAVAEHKNMPMEAVEIGSGEEVTVNEIAAMIIKLTGSKSAVTHLPMRRGETPDTRIKADISVLKNDFGFIPKISFAEGLTRTIGFYKSI